MLKIKRVYEDYDTADGFRILVDRLWPRGISKKEARIDLWLKEVAPSHELRQWFNHDPNKWEEFKKKYGRELLKNQEIVDQIKEIIKEHKKISLLYGAKDEMHNNAVVLKEFFEKKL